MKKSLKKFTKILVLIAMIFSDLMTPISVLANEITNFDNIKYEKDLANFFDNTGSFEEGKCCEELEKRLNKVCFG